jgi:hypothetical protein
VGSLADIRDEVDSKPAHAKPAYAAPKFFSALCVWATSRAECQAIFGGNVKHSKAGTGWRSNLKFHFDARIICATLDVAEGSRDGFRGTERGRKTQCFEARIREKHFIGGIIVFFLDGALKTGGDVERATNILRLSHHAELDQNSAVNAESETDDSGMALETRENILRPMALEQTTQFFEEDDQGFSRSVWRKEQDPSVANEFVDLESLQ